MKSGMARGVQVTFDAVDPHRLARWWAGLLGYRIEDGHALVAGLLANGVIVEADVVRVGWQLCFADAVAASDPEGEGLRLFFRRVPEPKVAKNRLHLDVPVDPACLDEEVERLQSGLWWGARTGRSGPKKGEDTRAYNPDVSRTAPPAAPGDTSMSSARSPAQQAPAGSSSETTCTRSADGRPATSPTPSSSPRNRFTRTLVRSVSLTHPAAVQTPGRCRSAAPAPRWPGRRLRRPVAASTPARSRSWHLAPSPRPSPLPGNGA